MAHTRPDSHAFTPLILDRLVTDGHADTDWSYYVLAACEGTAALTAALDGLGERAPAKRPAPKERDRAPAPEPPGAYLQSITVEGFRGIGARTTLTIPTGPGLTLVVGRNGSGKSSFAEALELLLTGRNSRWSDRSSVWKDGWRCLHQPHPTAIQAEFHVEGRGTVTVGREWTETAELDAHDAWFQEKGKPRQPYDDLGWQAACAVHRPLLPYSELGTVFDNPSGVHDALTQVLGLGELDQVLKVMTDERKARDERSRFATQRLHALLPRLEALSTTDARAARCLAALKKRKPALDDVEAVLNADVETPADPAVAVLRRATVIVPAQASLDAAAQALMDAAAAVEQSATTNAGRARALAALLEQALTFHATHRGDTCPVCNATGRLDDGWRTQTMAELQRLKREADAADRAHRQLDEAMAAARRLTDVATANIEKTAALGVSSAAPALEAIARWAAGGAITEARALADHLTKHAGALIQALEAYNEDVRRELAQREHVWRPLANDLRAWLPDGRAAERLQAQVSDLKHAERWFRDVQVDVRNERFRPIADQAIALWRTLRRQSNVELGSVQLQGTSTRRSVVLDVTVDGVAGAALGVMSQGELNALALSLFIPRASLAESPFRFMAIDDPVQSMDPSRVDGLARALQEVSTTRQVVVFTHDDRLSEAVQRLLIPATIIEVTRGLRSTVTAAQSLTPVRKYINDAMAVVKTDTLPDHVKRRVVPGFCRSAVEAAAMGLVRRKRLKSGANHAEIEQLLEEHETLRDRIALALFDDVEKRGEVGQSLNNRVKGGGDVFHLLNRGAHEPLDSDLQDLARGAERLAEYLQKQER